MSHNFSRADVGTVCKIIEQHADRGGMVDTRRAWKDLLNLPLDASDVQEIINRLEGTGYLWQWGEWIILTRPVRCPECNRVVEQRLSVHMHEDHPRPTAVIACVEWAD